MIKPFKFVNFWLKEEIFMKVVKSHQTTDFEMNPFFIPP